MIQPHPPNKPIHRNSKLKMPSRVEEERGVDDAMLKADINFLYGLLEKAKIERDEHLAIIARMRAIISSKDMVLTSAVKARNTEKRQFEVRLQIALV